MKSDRYTVLKQKQSHGFLLAPAHPLPYWLCHRNVSIAVYHVLMVEQEVYLVRSEVCKWHLSFLKLLSLSVMVLDDFYFVSFLTTMIVSLWSSLLDKQQPKEPNLHRGFKVWLVCSVCVGPPNIYFPVTVYFSVWLHSYCGNTYRNSIYLTTILKRIFFLNLDKPNGFV